MSFVIDDNFPEENCWVKTTFQTLAEHRQKEKQQKKKQEKSAGYKFWRDGKIYF